MSKRTNGHGRKASGVVKSSKPSKPAGEPAAVAEAVEPASTVEVETFNQMREALPDRIIGRRGEFFDHIDKVERDDLARMRLYWLLRHWQASINSALPEGHALRRLFAREFDDATVLSDEYYIPPMAVLRRLEKVVLGLPEDMRFIFGGWRVRGDLDMAEAVERASEMPVMACMTFILNDQSKTKAYHEYAVTDAVRGVEVQILEGTTRQEAIDQLQACLDYVKEFFDVAIVDADAANRLAAQRHITDQQFCERFQAILGVAD